MTRSRKAPPFFPFYVRDFLHAVRKSDMSPEDVGHLVMVMCNQWENQGPVSDEMKMYAAFSGWDIRVCRRGIAALESLGKIERTSAGLSTCRQAEEIAKYASKSAAAEARENAKRMAREASANRQSYGKDHAELLGEVHGEVSEKSQGSSDELLRNANEINGSASTATALPESRLQTADNLGTPIAPKGAPRQGRSKRRVFTASAETLAAQASYNAGAKLHGWVQSLAKAESEILKRLEQRLLEFGDGNLAAGLAAFERALSVIPQNLFLSGKKRGYEDFRLDLQRLLRTGGGLGNVLQSLLELADTSVASAYQQRTFTVERQAQLVAEILKARRPWDVGRYGGNPHAPNCCFTGEYREQLRAAYDARGAQRAKQPQAPILMPLNDGARVNGAEMHGRAH